MFDQTNLTEILSNTQIKTRARKQAELAPKKLEEKQKEKEQKRTQNKMSVLNLLEEDDFREEENDDSDYEGEAEDFKHKKKKQNKIKKGKIIKFGKINLANYFEYDPDAENEVLPNYNNITVKSRFNKPVYKLCSVCFNCANYMCKNCGERYCCIDCYKKHKEKKCEKSFKL